jgi:ferritin-like metal-binding protein YciE
MQRHILIAWLRDAHAMESRSLAVLRTRLVDVAKVSEAWVRVEVHLRETEQHMNRVAEALRLLGSPPASAPATAPAAGQIVSTPLFSDPLVRKQLIDLAAEQLEVAAYTVLIAAAEHASEPAVARLCRLNRGEDEEMAEWLEAQMPIALCGVPAEAPFW